MLMIMSWWPVLLQAFSDLGGSGQPGTCGRVPDILLVLWCWWPWETWCSPKEQTLCLLTWLIWPAHNLGDLRSLWVFFSHRHHGHLPPRQRDFSLAVQRAVVHQGELTGSVFRTGPSLLLAPSLSGTFFVQCSDGISIKSAAVVCKEQK